MKQGIHPTNYPTIIVDVTCGEEFKTLSTKKTGETREEDGIEYQVLRVDVSSASHPFFTGKQTFVDTAGRVERFKALEEKTAETMKDRSHKSKKEKRAARAEKKKGGNKKAAKDALKAAKAALADV